MIRHRAALPILICFVISIVIAYYLFDIGIFRSTGKLYDAAFDSAAEKSDILFKIATTTAAQSTSVVSEADATATPARLTVAGKEALPRDWTFTDRAPQGLDASWEKPKNLSIVGLVFFGRPPSASILDCYLKVWRIKIISVR